MLPRSHPHNHRPWSWPTLVALTLFQLWAAHAVAYFAHEYAHSFVAWTLGWKSNPLALHYGHPSLTVLLIQRGIDQNVDEVPIFRSGHGSEAAIISLAGALLGNALITLPLSRWLFHAATLRTRRGWAMFAFWVTVASVGNLLDYVPIRTFTDGTDLYQDMYAVERGFGWSPWTLLLLFGIPTTTVLAWFFLHVEPRTLRWLFPQSPARRISLALLTAFVLFCFYGSAGWSDGGPTSHRLSVLSVTLAFPLAALLTSLAIARNRSNPSSPTPA